MDNRWCIIGGPRSGHTWCEHVVFGGIVNLPNSIQLNEFVHSGVAATSTEDFKLDSNNNIIKIRNETVDMRTFTKDRCQLIFRANQKQPTTMVVIPEPWVRNDIDFLDFVQNLSTIANFKIITMKRSMFDRAVSWYYMSITRIAHQYRNDNGSTKFTSETGESFETFDPPVITANVHKFFEFLTLCIRYEMYIRCIESKVECIQLNYDTLVDDCKKNNIPANPNTAIKKTYSQGYKNLIKNYDELLDMYHQVKNIL